MKDRQPIFDTHSDIPSKIIKDNESGALDGKNSNTIEEYFIDDMRSNDIYARIAAIY
jgi:hypothetical protein